MGNRIRITKQVKQDLKVIIDINGYWHESIRNFISQFDYVTASKLHKMAQVYEKYQYGLEV